MTDDSSAPDPANSNFNVLAAIADLGEATPAAIAKKVGIAYSTVNPKLRGWEDAEMAERFRSDSGQTMWRLTERGKASTATPPQFADAAAEAESETAPSTRPRLASDADPAATQPPATPAGRPSDDSGDDEPTALTSPPLPAAGDTASSEPPSVDTASSDRDLSGDDEPGAESEVASADTAGRSVDPGTPAPAAAETAELAEDQDADPGTATASAPPAKRRRPKGALQASALAILHAHPDREYKVEEVKKLIDQADADTGYPRASHGAVSNALDSLERDGKAAKVEDRKAATFQITPVD
ncbi:MarR family winged helix-turn-helix transcriptional regulator [Actinoplanes sp. NPDC026623]|uniref:MarR family winged helix-turn-helix transcriptional regulator n=1 Tax=Actinoplanes sp. NPDC026623 TaxID=3155610 RepID=UPI00340E81C5